MKDHVAVKDHVALEQEPDRIAVRLDDSRPDCPLSRADRSARQGPDQARSDGSGGSGGSTAAPAETGARGISER
jgi:hypothetical protein